MLPIPQNLENPSGEALSQRSLIFPRKLDRRNTREALVRAHYIAAWAAQESIPVHLYFFGSDVDRKSNT
jgi:hypothetical protein